METINKINRFSRLDKSTQKTICVGIERLSKRVKTYLDYGKSFNERFMDDKLIHDAYVVGDKRFFLYKCRIKSVSLRLLYTFEDDNLVIVSHVMKKDSKFEYFDYFEKSCNEYLFKLNKENKSKSKHQIMM